jgi:hypothetical protein
MHQQHLQFFGASGRIFLLHKAILIEQLLREELGKGIGQNPASSLAQEGFL